MRPNGFTLAELLIALAILGVIATFTIPKVLTSQSSSQKNAVAKEAISMISGAYQAYKANSTPDANTEFDDLTPYMNYVTVDTSATLMDHAPGFGSIACSALNCLKLHNGGTIMYQSGVPFGGTTNTHYLGMGIDPDSSYSGNEDSVIVTLFFNERIATWGDADPVGTPNPAWFSWD